MLHILLTILKIIGIILLVIIGLVLLICACILFVPIRYNARIKYNEKPDICVKVTYLLSLISIKFTLKGNDKKTTLKILGFNIKSKDKSKKKNRKLKKKDSNENKDKKDSDDIFEEVDNERYIEHADSELNKAARENMKVREDDIEVVEDISGSSDGYESGEDNPKKEHEENTNNIRYKEGTETADKNDDSVKTDEKEKESLYQRIKKKIKAIKDKIIYIIKSFYGKIKKIIKSYQNFKEFINDKHTKEAYKLVKSELVKVLKYIRPRKVKGYVNFGFEDPSVTGKVLGGYYMFTKGGFKKLRVNPDFDNSVFETDAHYKGRIRLYYLLYIALKLYMNKDFKYVLKRRRTNG